MQLTGEYRLKDGRIDTVDCLKGFSIFTIVLMHLIAYMDSLPSVVQTLALVGGSGVHVFFLCSGIGLYLSYLKSPTGYIAFMKRRFGRIYIPYILVIIVSFFLPWLYSGPDRIVALLSHVFLFKMFMPEYLQSFGWQFWFISTIIQLYLLFIPMCGLKDRVGNKAFFGIFMAVSICWWLICYFLGVSDVRVWSNFCLQYIWEFALGFIIAEKLYEGKTFKVNKIILAIAAVAGIGLQAVLAIKSDALSLFNDIPALIGYTSLALLLLGIGFIKETCLFLSKFSYELFLVHIMVIDTVFHFTKPEGILRQSAVGCAALLLSLAAGYFYNKFLRTVIYRKRIR